MSVLRVRPSQGLHGEVTVPGDKSISHRALILGAIAEGDTTIRGFLRAEDTLNTARALQAMGVEIEGLDAVAVSPSPESLPRRRGGQGGEAPDVVVVHGVGLHGLQPPAGPLDLGNSGTGMRLLMGVLAGQSFPTTLTGDESLSKRPMDRVAVPLGMMGIRVEGQGERCTPPVMVHGGKPRPLTYQSPVASAQVKSAVLLAGLYSEGKTTVREPMKSRDHTERMLAGFGAKVEEADLAEAPYDYPGPHLSGVYGPARLQGQEVSVPGDFSSAAYFLAAAFLCPESSVTVRNVLLNPTRTGLLEACRCPYCERLRETVVAGELLGDLRAVTLPDTPGVEVPPWLVPACIDEVPLLAVIGTQGERATICGAQELRVKESDRISVVVQGLRAMGAKVEERPDGMVIQGPTKLHGAVIDPHLDHRIAMSFAVAGLIAEGETIIKDAECIATSFPGFVETMGSVGADMEMEEEWA